VNTRSILFVLILLVCAPSDIHAQRTIRIGATMSETGAYSTQGIPARDGYLLCSRDVNESGGLLGRPVEFIILDDESSTSRAVELYEHLIEVDRVDLVMGPYGSTLTEAVAPVTEANRMVHISPLAATSSIWEQGREYLFMVLPPAELFLVGLMEMAAERGLERVAVLQEDALFPRAAGAGAATRARDLGMQVVAHESYPSGTTDFSELLTTIRDREADVVAMAASALGDFAAVVRQMNESGFEVVMFGTSGAVTEFQQELGALAENVYGLSAWEPSLPHPGVLEFAKAYETQFGRAPSFHAAGAYGSCRLLVEAIESVESLDQELIRDALLSMETTTVFGPFAVDERGYQTANQGVFIQWQDGQKVIVWPEDVAKRPARE
jgi:branched-chain amino acid transport system substrate-binding protein